MVSNLRSALELRSDGPPPDSLVQAEIATVRASRNQVTVEMLAWTSCHSAAISHTSIVAYIVV